MTTKAHLHGGSRDGEVRTLEGDVSPFFYIATTLRLPDASGDSVLERYGFREFAHLDAHFEFECLERLTPWHRDEVLGDNR